jgi:hypothetical protein
MTDVTYTTWARLEPRVSDPSLTPGVVAAVEDPLWLLGRQWQLGEFDGEDVGTPTGVDVYGSYNPVERLLLGAASAQNKSRAVDYDAADAPLEYLVARERAPDPEATVALAVDIAARVAAELQGGTAPKAVLDALRADYAFDAAKLGKTLAGCAAAEAARLELLATRLFDGAAFALAAKQDFAAATSGWPAAAKDAIKLVLADIESSVDLELVRKRAADSAEPVSWNSERLESEFAIGANGSAGEVVLRADDWDGEALDWWAFDAATETKLGAASAPKQLSGPGGKPLTRLPGRLGFSGAPGLRYWEFEDAAVNLVAATAAPHESPLMAVLQFAFVFGGDWSSVPIELPVGSRVIVDSVVVTDSFGVRTLLMHAGIDANKPDDELTRLWFTSGDASGAFMIPPSLGPRLDGEALEEVAMLRDEQANLAWALELTTADAAGHPVAWTALAARPPEPPESKPDFPPDRPTLRYRLSSEVPSHWFPMVPEADSAGGRLARYRVGVLPSGGSEPPQLPRSLLLRELAAAGLAEQELLRDGRRFERRPSYARWSDGATLNWVARRTRGGAGEGSSGLRYDTFDSGDGS